jgi:hypothetical protein
VRSGQTTATPGDSVTTHARSTSPTGSDSPGLYPAPGCPSCFDQLASPCARLARVFAPPVAFHRLPFVARFRGGSYPESRAGNLPPRSGRAAEGMPPACLWRGGEDSWCARTLRRDRESAVGADPDGVVVWAGTSSSRVRDRVPGDRVHGALAVATSLVGWAAARYPSLLARLVGLSGGEVILVPALIYLYALFQ